MCVIMRPSFFTVRWEGFHSHTLELCPEALDSIARIVWNILHMELPGLEADV